MANRVSRMKRLSGSSLPAGILLLFFGNCTPSKSHLGSPASSDPSSAPISAPIQLAPAETVNLVQPSVNASPVNLFTSPSEALSNDPSVQLVQTTHTIFNDQVSLSVSREIYGSAVVSLKYKGSRGWEEFVLNYGAGGHSTTQRGASLQTAIFYDYPNSNYSDPSYICRNPIEAGSVWDLGVTNPFTGVQGVSGITSPAYIVANQSSIFSQTQMAFWVDPSQCGGSYGYNLPFYLENKALSGTYLTKNVKVGALGFSNIVEFKIKISVPEAHQYSQFDVLTGYLSLNKFSKFFTYDPSTKLASEVYGHDQESTTATTYPTYSPLTTIVSSPDLEYAMAIYSPDIKSANGGYTRSYWRSLDVTAWEAYVRHAYLAPGNYEYKLYLVLGKLTDVQNTLRQIVP